MDVNAPTSAWWCVHNVSDISNRKQFKRQVHWKRDGFYRGEDREKRKKRKFIKIAFNLSNNFIKSLIKLMV